MVEVWSLEEMREYQGLGPRDQAGSAEDPGGSMEAVGSCLQRGQSVLPQLPWPPGSGLFKGLFARQGVSWARSAASGCPSRAAAEVLL